MLSFFLFLFGIEFHYTIYIVLNFFNSNYCGCCCSYGYGFRLWLLLLLLVMQFLFLLLSVANHILIVKRLCSTVISCYVLCDEYLLASLIFILFYFQSTYFTAVITWEKARMLEGRSSKKSPSSSAQRPFERKKPG